MRLIIPVDSRTSDTAGIFCADLSTRQLHAFSFPGSAHVVRNGFRGGFLEGKRLTVCRSYGVDIYRIDWPKRDVPSIETLTQIRRNEWLEGGPANADLHIVHPHRDGHSLLVANSYCDSIDHLDERGVMLARTHLWDISPEIARLVPERRTRAADLCHINYFFSLAEELVATLGNLNGTRTGTFLNLQTGRLSDRRFAFPHDGLMIGDRLFLSESGSQSVTVLSGVERFADIEKAEATTAPIIVNHGSAPESRIWVRGLARIGEMLAIGCSQFSMTPEVLRVSQPSFIRLIDIDTLERVADVTLPKVQALTDPVIYSIIPYDMDEALHFAPAGDLGLASYPEA